MDELREQAFSESELCHVLEPGPCALCGRLTLRMDTGGTWCADEDSTCWRGGEAAIQKLAEERDGAI